MTSLPKTSNRSRAGFTIIEVMISMVILAVGLLALATTSIFASTQVRVADIKTEQSLAVQEIIERMQSSPFENIDDRAEGSAEQVGSFRLWWDVSQPNTYVKRVEIYTRGPGFNSGSGWTSVAVDTFQAEIAEMPVN